MNESHREYMKGLSDCRIEGKERQKKNGGHMVEERARQLSVNNVPLAVGQATSQTPLF